MSLTVLNVAYPLAPVGPDAVGGAEQVLYRLDEALVRSGHRSLVIACAGSRTHGQLLPSPLASGPLDATRQRAASERCRVAIVEALARWSIDLVHLHGIDFPLALPPPGVPVLATLHLPVRWYEPGVFTLTRPRTHLVCVSEAQRRDCPPEAGWLPVVTNGVVLPPPGETPPAKENFVLSLGRVCPEKGYHLALDAAARARVPLRLAGQVFPYVEHEMYFRREIQPRLDNDRRFLGPVGGARKHELLASARALLVPSLVPETGSLVAMEALARGTPVIAFAHGVLPELIDHGRTGFIVRDVAEMADAIAASAELDPEACREAARQRFSAEHMCARYLKLYHQLAAGAAAPGLFCDISYAA